MGGVMSNHVHWPLAGRLNMVGTEESWSVEPYPLFYKCNKFS